MRINYYWINIEKVNQIHNLQLKVIIFLIKELKNNIEHVSE